MSLSSLVRTPVRPVSVLLFALALLLSFALPQNARADQYALSFVGDLWFPADSGGCGGTPIVGGSDVWGYTAPDGTEYAIMGILTGVAVVRIPDMTVIQTIAGPQNNDCYYHRDIKTYQNYAYVVSENTGTNQGIQILDLSTLPDSVRVVGSYTTASDTRSHNLSIDTATGYMYVCKQNYSGFRVISLANPESPVDVGFAATPDIHDVYARNDTVYVSEGWNGTFSLFNAANKASPTLITRLTVPSAGYAHNAWASVDGQHMLTTEETSSKTVKVWNIADPLSITQVGSWLGGSNLAHNVQVEGDFAFVSHYSYGVSVLDISTPSTPVEVAHYDTYPASDATAFWGCWGVYPHTTTGYVYTSDIEGKLTVLRFDNVTGVAGAADAGGADDSGSDVVPEVAHALTNAPNPFNPRTVISFALREPAPVDLTIFDSAGRVVRSLVQGEFADAGTNAREWNGNDDAGRPVASGKYYYRLAAAGDRPFTITRPMVLIR
ncbi:MAG: choice-of-anchor B family protein [Gemmatimonadetes bacterium]|nr:choice-of-anchor B family protein [Gemmatimonadota bacterium]